MSDTILSSRADALIAVVFGDLHLSHTPPSCRTNEYVNELGDLLRQVGEIAAKVKPDVVCCTGDWFHRKRLSTHRDVATLSEMLRTHLSDWLPILSPVGNHDTEGSSEAIDAQPLSVMVKAGLIRLVDRNPVYVQTANHNHFAVTGVSYGQRTGKRMNDNHAPLAGALILTHDDVATGDAARMSFTLNHRRSIRNMLGEDAIVCVANGHLHEDRSVVHDANSGTTFLATGALGRTSSVELQAPIASVVKIKAGAPLPQVRCINLVTNDEATFITSAEQDAENPDERELSLQQFVDMLNSDAGTDADDEDSIREAAAAAGIADHVVDAALKHLQAVPR